MLNLPPDLPSDRASVRRLAALCLVFLALTCTRETPAADGDPAIEIAPMAAFFVAGERGSGGERTLDIINHDAQPLSIEEVPHPTHIFVTRLETVQPGQHYRLTLSLRPEGPSGMQTNLVTLKTSSAATPVLSIPVHTYLRERVYAFPQVVDLGTVKLSDLRAHPNLIDSMTQTVTIYQTGGRDFKVNVGSDLPLKLAATRGLQGDRYQVSVRLTAPPTAAGPLRGSIRVQTNDALFPEVVVPVTGLVLNR
jgi:hypothetical protein